MRASAATLSRAAIAATMVASSVAACAAEEVDEGSSEDQFQIVPMYGAPVPRDGGLLRDAGPRRDAAADASKDAGPMKDASRDTGPSKDAAKDGATDADDDDPGQIVPMYGAPVFVDAGPSDAKADVMDAGNNDDEPGQIVPLYGAPIGEE
ncbi:MAG: hypothetical protein KBF88_00840 [Polyangiaceae bacterium]|nr:hypothetical protein [Polyangiaceae bacterium]